MIYILYSIITFYKFITINTVYFIGSLILFSLIIVCYLNIVSFFLYSNVKDQFHNIYDRVIPLNLLLLPILGFFWLNNEPLISRVWFLIICYIIIFLPVFNIYSIIRNWNILDKSEIVNYQWTNPKITIFILEALVYPLIFGLFFCILRYLRLDSGINVLLFINKLPLNYLPWIFATCGIWFYIIYLLFQKLQQIRKYYWQKTLDLCHAVNLYLIQFELFFIILSKLHKFCFLLYVICSDHRLVFMHKQDNYKFTFFTVLRFFIVRFLAFFYFHYYIIFIIIIFVLIIELLLTNGFIYYGAYILFIYPIVLAITKLIYFFSQYDWLHFCCFSDVLHNNWDKPRYPYAFWAFVESEDMFLFNWELNEFSLNQRKFILKKQFLNTQLLNKYSTLNIYGLKNTIFYNRIISTKYTFFPRIAIHYRDLYKLRWFATIQEISSTVTTPVLQYNKAIGFTVKNIYQKNVLIDNNWHHYNKIISNPYPKAISLPNNFFIPSNFIPNTYIKFEDYVEYNTLLHFSSLAKKYNFNVNLYKDRPLCLNFYNKRQQEVDIVFDFSNSWIPNLNNCFKEYLIGYDLKNIKKPGCGHNYILIMLPHKASYMLNLHKKTLFSKYHFNSNKSELLNTAYKTLAQSLFNQIHTTYIETWLIHISNFPIDFLPPIFLTSCINKEFFSIQTLKELDIAQTLLLKASSYLDKNLNSNLNFSDTRNEVLMHKSKEWEQILTELHNQ